MNTNTDTDMSLDDDFYGDVDLTQEERDMIHEDSLVGRAYDDHQDWKDEESLREFCTPYVTWATQLESERLNRIKSHTTFLRDTFVEMGMVSQEQHDSATAVSDYLRALIGDDRD